MIHREHPDAGAYPLRFTPILLEKVWGGDALARLGKGVPPGARIGESWELADLSQTSASGAGGQAQRSTIAEGALRGRTLHDALERWGQGLLPGWDGRSEFPLLVKFLDAHEDLSVQVHPSPAYARAHPGSHLKTECWYILAAEPGAKLYKGFSPERTPTRDELRASALDGSIVERLEAVPAVAGECHNLPSGTVHALGAGIVVAEVQTPSDTTFRLFDWGRRGRALHLDEAVACADLGPAPRATRLPAGEGEARLVTSEFFTLDQRRMRAGERAGLTTDDTCVVVVGIEGRASLGDGESFADVEVAPGTTLLVPACVAPRAIVTALTDASILLAQIPA